jgi:hypothetical protein
MGIGKLKQNDHIWQPERFGAVQSTRNVQANRRRQESQRIKESASFERDFI